MGLPSLLAFKGLHMDAHPKTKYLGVTNRNELEFNDVVLSEKAKFQLESAKSGGGEFHIRSSYSNKFFVRKGGSDHFRDPYIVAEASEPEEDKRNPKCTLFSAEFYGETWNLVHVQLGLRLSVDRFKLRVSVSSSDNYRAYFVPVDFNTLVVLPQRIALKGDNDRYLRALTNQQRYLAFNETDPGSGFVHLETFHDEDANVRIKSIHWDRYLRATSDYIRADQQNGGGQDTLFQPRLGRDGSIALYSLERNLYLRRNTGRGEANALMVTSNNVIREAQFKVEEAVSNRIVEVLNFRTDDARIYELTPIAVPSQIANNPFDHEIEMNLTFEYTETTTNRWTNTISVGTTVSTTFLTGIPFIAQGRVRVSVSANYKHEWSKEVTKTQRTSASYKTKVPPKRRYEISCIALQGRCDVPFSYRQTDTLAGSGKTVSNTFDDGIYKGLNAFVVEFNAKDVTLP